MHSCLRQHLASSRRRFDRISGRRRILNTLSQSNALGRRWLSDNSPEDNTTSSSETTPSKSPDFSPFQTPSANKKVGRNVPKGVVVAPPPTNVLPELPAKPQYPCKHLSDDEVNHYLRPLYERGWGIFTRLPNQEHPVPTLQLARDIHFIWHFALLEFIRELNVITAAEMHHPKVSYEYQILEIRTQTHTATLNNSKTDNEPEENRDTKILAGVTLRDVRLAYLMERALEPFYDLNKVATRPGQFAKLETLSVASRLKAPTAQSPQVKCIICGENHWASSCPSRFTAKAHLLCEICGGDHWKFACSQYKHWRRATREQQKYEFRLPDPSNMGQKRNF
ncbi:hypothetical protein FRC20_003678 [Serendipita sp. 405]|nr:hypothetical protein FRC20_003678 [Serendipita sp. 405]